MKKIGAMIFWIIIIGAAFWACGTRSEGLILSTEKELSDNEDSDEYELDPSTGKKTPRPTSSRLMVRLPDILFSRIPNVHNKHNDLNQFKTICQEFSMHLPVIANQVAILTEAINQHPAMLFRQFQQQNDPNTDQSDQNQNQNQNQKNEKSNYKKTTWHISLTDNMLKRTKQMLPLSQESHFLKKEVAYSQEKLNKFFPPSFFPQEYDHQLTFSPISASYKISSEEFFPGESLKRAMTVTIQDPNKKSHQYALYWSCDASKEPFKIQDRLQWIETIQDSKVTFRHKPIENESYFLKLTQPSSMTTTLIVKAHDKKTQGVHFAAQKNKSFHCQGYADAKGIYLKTEMLPDGLLFALDEKGEEILEGNSQYPTIKEAYQQRFAESAFPSRINMK